MNADALPAAKVAVRPLSLKELRLQLRARGLTPAGVLDTLRMRLEEHMAETGDCSIKAELAQPHPADAAATYGSSLLSGGNYKSGGQLLQPPPAAPSSRRQHSSAAAAAPFSTDANAAADGCRDTNNEGRSRNNYARPAGQQNVGNYLTGRPSSRGLAPPGGTASIVFGDDESAPAAAAVSRVAAASAPAPCAVEQEEGKQVAAVAEEDAAAAAAGEEEQEPSFDAPAAAAAPPVPNAPTARINCGVSGIGEGGAHATKGPSSAHANNNYVRSEGKNVGNFLSGRPTSRVLAPPGGKSSITFG